MASEQPKTNSVFKILVVEDNHLDFELMGSALSSHFPCAIERATTKAEFEALLAKGKPDVIVSDSNVLSFDGFTALKIAREKSPNVPFVFCSGTGPDGTEETLASGIGWVDKDNGFSSLVAFVKKVLDSKEGQ